MSDSPPDGYAAPELEDVPFPQLCKDPLVDGSVEGTDELAAQEALTSAPDEPPGRPLCA